MSPPLETRLCSGCGVRKSIGGVWYLIRHGRGGAEAEDATDAAPAGSRFVCESCVPHASADASLRTPPAGPGTASADGAPGSL